MPVREDPLQNLVQASFDPQFLFHDRHEHVNADRNPDLGLHGVVAGTVESFDSQMLLDPLEEQLDLPTAPVELRDGQRRQGEVVGQEHQSPLACGVVERDAAQRFGIQPRRLRPRQDNRLIAAQAGRFVDGTTGASRAIQVSLAARHKECRRGREAIQSLKIDVAAVHHIEGTRLEDEVIEDADVVGLAIGDANKRGDVPLQVEEGMEFDGALVLAEVGPRE